MELLFSVLLQTRELKAKETILFLSFKIKKIIRATNEIK